MQGNEVKWTTRLRLHAFRLLFVYVGLLLATFPFPRPYLPDLGKLLLPYTTALAEATASLLAIRRPYLRELASDNLLLYVHFGNMFLLALLAAGIWGWRDRKAVAYPRLQYLLELVSRYFLAAAMFTYGFAKVFKWQFYLPEPNTLFTPLGEVSRDLLFWSTMGSSQGYNAFMGWTELLVGALLLFRRSRLAGGLLGIGVMVNVLAVNLSFDISVKLYSGLLLGLCCVVVGHDWGRLFAFLRGKPVATDPAWVPPMRRGWRQGLVYGFKALVVCALLFDALGPYFSSGNFDDDAYPRPPLHGAYEVVTFIRNDAVEDCREGMPWRRVFVHRQGYFIVQTDDDKMRDFVLRADLEREEMVLEDVARGREAFFLFSSHDGQLSGMHGYFEGDTLDLRLKPLDWRAMPLLRGDFSWTSDGL